jgi:hypothetical protein
MVYTYPENMTKKIATHPSIQNIQSRKSTSLAQFLDDTSMLMNIIHELDIAENHHGVMACASLLFTMTAALSAFPIEHFDILLLSVTYHLDDLVNKKYLRYAKAMQCMVFADLKFKQAHSTIFGKPYSVSGLTYLSPITTPVLKPMSKDVIYEQEEITRKRFRRNSSIGENSEFFVVEEEAEQKNDNFTDDDFSTPIQDTIDWEELNID